MQRVSFTGKSHNVNFDLSVAFSSSHHQSNLHQSSVDESRCLKPITSSSSLLQKPKNIEDNKNNTVEKSFGEDMPGGNRRKVRNVEQRRKMKLHNRKDDIPDCDSLEIIDFDENISDPSFKEPYFSDSDTSSGSCKSRKYSSKQQQQREEAQLSLQPNPELDVSMTSARNQSFQSCPASSNDYYSSSQSSASTTGTTATSAMSSRRRSRHHKRRHRGKESALMIFLQNLLENFGQVFTEFFMYLCSVIKVNSNSPTPAAGVFLLLVSSYFFISYIEVSLAGLIEIICEWLWPGIHISLRMIERCFKGIGNAFAGLDDLAESSYCDMASMWCDWFNLMCSNRCSFTKFALERLRR